VQKILDPNQEISVHEYQKIVQQKIEHFLLDVRHVHQFQICSLHDAYNIPLSKLEDNMENIKTIIQKNDGHLPIYVVCRRGIDSQLAVKILCSHGLGAKSIAGGIHEWAKTVDSSFPIY